MGMSDNISAANAQISLKSLMDVCGSFGLAQPSGQNFPHQKTYTSDVTSLRSKGANKHDVAVVPTANFSLTLTK